MQSEWDGCRHRRCVLTQVSWQGGSRWSTRPLPHRPRIYSKTRTQTPCRGVAETKRKQLFVMFKVYTSHFLWENHADSAAPKLDLAYGLQTVTIQILVPAKMIVVLARQPFMLLLTKWREFGPKLAFLLWTFILSTFQGRSQGHEKGGGTRSKGGGGTKERMANIHPRR